MAYRFDGVDDWVSLALAPFTGYVAGPLTIAIFIKQTNFSTVPYTGIVKPAWGPRVNWRNRSGGTTELLDFDGHSHESTISGTSTSTWYLWAVTYAGGAAIPRFHLHNGTSWSHASPGSSTITNSTIEATDLWGIGGVSGFGFISADIVCCGWKKSDSSDVAVETLSRTSWQSWRDFNFTTLIGFETAGTLSDLGVDGRGDEVSRVGTSLVSDPAGWSWAASGGGGATVPPVLTCKAGAASVDPEDYNSLVDAVAALGGAVTTRKAGSGQVNTSDYNAVVDAVITLGGAVRDRKAGASAVDSDDFNAVIDAVKLLGAP